MVVGPILSQARSDIFCDNENGPNFLFKNKGNGTFADMASQAGEHGTGRGEHERTSGRVKILKSCGDIRVLFVLSEVLHQIL